MKSFDDTENHRTVQLLNKIVVLTTILFVCLANISMYSNITTPASAISQSSHVIIGDSPQYLTDEGLTKDMQPWENGMRTNPKV